MACCTTIRELVTRAGRILGDVDHTVWPVDVLVGHINEALCEIQSYRPDAFIDTVTFPLVPGREQHLPEEYRKIVSVNANMAGDGTIGRSVSEVSEDMLRAFSMRPCSGTVDGCFEIVSWSRNKTDPRIFYVSPPVPAGRRPIVSATVVKYPPKHSPTDLDACLGIDCAYDAQVLDWMLARAYEEDIESPRNTEMAARHKRNFYDGLGIEYLQESRFESGNWLGRTSDGDSAKSVGTMPPADRRA